ncbi:hypothetical protein D3C84_437830 [compost metagenome]
MSGAIPTRPLKTNMYPYNHARVVIHNHIKDWPTNQPVTVNPVYQINISDGGIYLKSVTWTENPIAC